MVNGEMAEYAIESDLDCLMEDGIDPSEVSDLYRNLKLEQERRNQND